MKAEVDRGNPFRETSSGAQQRRFETGIRRALAMLTVLLILPLVAFVYAASLGYSVLAASLTRAVMTLPVIITSTREAIAAVPVSFREACWNMGATRWQTLRAVVLPNALPGILTGVILQVSRTAGGTAPILFTGAVFYRFVQAGDILAYRLEEQCMALAMHLNTLATQVPRVRPARPAATAITLLGVVVVVNAAAILVRTRTRSHRRR